MVDGKRPTNWHLTCINCGEPLPPPRWYQKGTLGFLFFPVRLACAGRDRAWCESKVLFRQATNQQERAEAQAEHQDVAPEGYEAIGSMSEYGGSIDPRSFSNSTMLWAPSRFLVYRKVQR